MLEGRDKISELLRKIIDDRTEPWVTLGDSERQAAEKFEEAVRTYRDDPVALHLRAMNMLYEGLKQNAKIVIVPSTAAFIVSRPAGMKLYRSIRSY